YFAKPVASLVLSLVIAIAVRNVHDALLIGFLLLALATFVWLVARYLKWRTTNFVVTSDRLIYRTGVLAKQGLEIPLERVNNILCSQRIIERILRSGDLVIESAGERGQQTIADVANPFIVQNVVYKAMEAAQARDHDRMAGRPGPSIPEQIEKLDELRQRGIISQAEFDQKKAQLLDRM
ncbi:MAG: PH domain-containing protein, partial [Acidimicrobiales bacterium]